MRSRALSGSPGASSGPQHQAWSLCSASPPAGPAGLGPGSTSCWCSHLLDLAYQSPVQLPRWQTDVPEAHLVRSRSRQPQPTADCIHTYLSCPEWGLLTASLYLSGVSSSGPPQPRWLPVSSPLCLSVHRPCQSCGPTAPRSPLLTHP